MLGFGKKIGRGSWQELEEADSTRGDVLL